MANNNPSPTTRFKAGESGNPGGRPKGETLKSFAQRWLISMTDAEKEKFLQGISPETVWKMAEGNPKNDVDANSRMDLNESIFKLNRLLDDDRREFS